MSRDLRKYTRQTTYRLIIGGIILVFLVGDGLIYLIYGAQSALTGFLCILGGLLPVALIVLILWGLEWVARRADRD